MDGEAWAFIAGVIAGVAAWFVWHDIGVAVVSFVGVSIVVGVCVLLYS